MEGSKHEPLWPDVKIALTLMTLSVQHGSVPEASKALATRMRDEYETALDIAIEAAHMAETAQRAAAMVRTEVVVKDINDDLLAACKMALRFLLRWFPASPYANEVIQTLQETIDKTRTTGSETA